MENISNDIIDKVRNIYFDPSQGLGSANDIYEKLNKKVKLKDIKEILKNINVKQIKDTKNIDKKKLFIPIVSEPNSFQCDLTFYN